MAGTSLIIRKQIERSITGELQRYVKDCDSGVIHVDQADPERFYFLRPSSFPFCGLKKFLESQTGEFLEPDRIMTFGMDYYTSVGTSVHTVYQRYLGKGGKLLADWSCKCGRKDKQGEWVKKITRFTTYKFCKVCKSARVHEELEVWYKNTVVGHVDSVYVDKKGRYWVVDYKTTSVAKVKEHKEKVAAKKKGLFPYHSNTFQITSYVPLLEQQYGIKIEGSLLFYISRDNPLWQYVMIANYMDVEDKAERLRSLHRDVKIHRKMLKTSTLEEGKLLIKYKLCDSLKDYKDNYRDQYNPCPYLNKCVGAAKPSMLKEIKKALPKRQQGTNINIYPLIQHAPDNVRRRLLAKSHTS